MGNPADSLLYLYCIVEADTGAHRLLEVSSEPGLDPGSPLFPVEYAGLVAVVSRVEAEEFAEEPLNALLADLPRLSEYALRHEEAVRGLLRHAPALLPVTFGAVYQSRERVTDLLRQRGADFRRILDRVRGRQEWGLKVVRDTARTLPAAEASSPVLRELAAEVAAARPGRAYLLQKQRERLVASEAQRMVADALHAICDELSAASAAVRYDALPAEAAGPIGLVLKAAFLVDADRIDAFRAIAGDLRLRYEPAGLSLEVSGPWAPYSFVGGDGDRL